MHSADTISAWRVEKTSVFNSRWLAFILVVLSCGLSVGWGVHLAQTPNGFADVKGLYYASRCFLEGHSPYLTNEVAAVYRAERVPGPAESAMFLQTVTVNMNLPPTFVLFAPLALLSFKAANTILLSMAAVVLVAAAWLVWRQGAHYAPAASLALICFLLANNEIAFEGGNTAVLIMGLSVLGAWCLAEDRFGLVGVFCLGLSLAIKPHDCGFIWLYFLLAGGIYRRRALQALAVAAAPIVAGVLWFGHAVPHWLQDYQASMKTISGDGGLNQPGPFAITGHGGGIIIDLQSAITVVCSNPKIYNAISYAVCGALLLFWAWRTMQLRGSRARVWLGLAAAMAPTFLITYHRGQDAKILLLAVPACMMLWSKRNETEHRVRGRLALLLIGLAIVSTADVPLTVWEVLRPFSPVGMGGIFGKALAMVLLVPTPMILLAMGIFYLWVYVKSDAILAEPVKVQEPKGALLVPEPA
jgi:hypothetical protein